MRLARLFILFFIKNHIVERTWVEVNNRVNYPIKKILIGMVEREEVDIHDDHHKYCISWFTIHVCAAGLKMFVESWNAHPLPSKCFLHNYNYITNFILIT